MNRIDELRLAQNIVAKKIMVELRSALRLTTIRDIKILDPALGSGHFLVVALDMLFVLYKEEAQHRGEEGEQRWSDKAIVEHILEHNLYGIDIDSRAVQIASAALWLKAKTLCGEARPRRMNLVASNLKLSGLPDDDLALVEFCRGVERDTGISEDRARTIIDELKQADRWGSLLKVDEAILKIIEEEAGRTGHLRTCEGPRE